MQCYYYGVASRVQVLQDRQAGEGGKHSYFPGASRCRVFIEELNCFSSSTTKYVVCIQVILLVRSRWTELGLDRALFILFIIAV